MTNTAPVRKDQPVDDREAHRRRVENFKSQMDAQVAEITKTIPAGMTAERFMGIMQTSVLRDPKLLTADRSSLWLSARQCAQDGLVPDGKEAALVRFWNKKMGCEVVQYFPMVFGIIKRVRNSGDVSGLVAAIVYAGDTFRHWIDDQGEHVIYEASDSSDRTSMTKVFAMAKLKDGTIMVEVMTPAEIERTRSVSRAKDDGPWVNWFEEMAKKTVIRRLAKRLPVSEASQALIRRVDDFYDLANSPGALPQTAAPRTIAGRLDALAAMPAKPTENARDTGKAETDVATQPSEGRSNAINSDPSEGHDTRPQDNGFPGDTPAQDAPSPKRVWGSDESIRQAYDEGVAAKDANLGMRAMPAEYRNAGFENELAAWKDGWRDRNDELNPKQSEG